MNKWGRIVAIFAVLLFSNILFSNNVEGCKDIIACGDATDGDYNLLMKVRDPSRPGLQVLSIIPEGYNYDYHHPWNGKTMSFTTEQKYIGVASKDDVIPNIVKAGMTLTEAGLAFGDADSNSRWKNPTKYAWDDFDWIRYSCEKANTEDEAVELLTKGAVDTLHATGVSENLFIIGPDKGYVVEADAFHYDIQEINDGVAVMHNYPKELWTTQSLNKRPISRFFDTNVEKFVRNKQVVRLQSIYGVKVVDIGEDFISVKPVPFLYIAKTGNIGIITKIGLGERKSVGDFSVTLLEIDGNRAKIKVTNVFKAWEEEMLKHIQPKYGGITILDMINWSRLHRDDLNELRPMCQENEQYEAVAIYKIPKENYEVMSIGWFSPNHACSSIYVPFHICDKEIYDSYENGNAAQLSLDLIDAYGPDYLSNNFSKTEKVFLREINYFEGLSNSLQDDEISSLFTSIDTGMQYQAFLTQELWLEASKGSWQNEITKILSTIWDINYFSSLNKMKNAVSDIVDISTAVAIRNKIVDIALDICKTKIDSTKILGYDTSFVEDEYNKGRELLNKDDYEDGFNVVLKTYSDCEQILDGVNPEDTKENKEKEPVSINVLFSVFLLILAAILILIIIKKK